MRTKIASHTEDAVLLNYLDKVIYDLEHSAINISHTSMIKANGVSTKELALYCKKCVQNGVPQWQLLAERNSWKKNITN